jgi:hypothetical protein
MKKLYRTTIIIWSEYDANQVELEDLAYEATSGNALCTEQKSVLVDPAGDDNSEAIADFFGDYDDDDDDAADDGDSPDTGTTKSDRFEDLGLCD